MRHEQGDGWRPGGGNRMSTETQPLSPRPKPGTPHGARRNGVEHRVRVGRVAPDGFPLAKVDETVMSPPPVVEDLVALRRRRRVYRQVVKPTVDRLAGR